MYRSTRLSCEDARRRQFRCRDLFEQRGFGKPNYHGSNLFCEKGGDVHAACRDAGRRGRQQWFTRSGHLLTFSLVVPAGSSESVQIEYLNHWNVSDTNVAKKGFRVAVLRNISDFRDMTLSRWSWGRALTGFYYHESIDSIELKVEHALPVLLAAVIALIVVSLTLIRLRRRRSAVSTGPIESSQ